MSGWRHDAPLARVVAPLLTLNLVFAQTLFPVVELSWADLGSSLPPPTLASMNVYALAGRHPGAGALTWLVLLMLDRRGWLPRAGSLHASAAIAMLVVTAFLLNALALPAWYGQVTYLLSPGD